LETEPNNAAGTATGLTGSLVRITGNIYPAGDVDYYSLIAQAGDRVYAAAMTSWSANASVDSQLALLASDGSTVLELDNDDGIFGATSSTIAGATIPVSGTYYLRVNHASPAGTLRPYELWVRVRSGAPTAETETNDTIPGQPLPASGWVSGALSSATDVDYYAVTLNAGDSVMVSLDLDPERDGIEWNGQLALGQFGDPLGILPIINDAGTATPDSEAHFVTVKDAGTYYVIVSAATGGTFGTYQLSVSVLPAATPPGTTYTSTDVPVTIPTGPGIVSSTITIPDDIRIGQLKVAIDLTHNFMADLDVTLTAPDGNTVVLFTDIGSTTVGAQTRMNLILDDTAALPPLFAAVSGLVLKPELNSRLEWFKGQRAQGTWTLTIRDDATGDGGPLNSWSLIVVEEEPLPDGTPRTIFSTDFESNDGGFTHSGTQDEWEWGAPASPPINTANSGVNAWKTDLDNTYENSSNQDLFSPEIDLTGVTSGAALLEWAMKFQLEPAQFDYAFVEVQEVGGAGRTRKVWEWLGADMVASIGNPVITVQEAAGWGRYRALLNDFFGKRIRLRFHLDTDNSVQRAGLAIDDVSVTAFER
jgi:subtilisin-like proprotein convertase family protein